MKENKIFDKDMSIMIKGIAIILMLFHHFFAFPEWLVDGNTFIGIGSTYSCIERKIGLFGVICVEIFAAITGYASYYIVKKGISYRDIIKKLIKFLQDYWVILFLFFLPVGYILEQKTVGLWELVKNMFGYDITIVKFAWYVRFYLALQLLLPLLICISKLNPVLFITMSIVPFGVINYILYFLKWDSIQMVSYIIEFNDYVPVFYVGYLIAKYRVFDYIDHKLKQWKIDNLIIYFAVLPMIYYFRGKLITYFPNYNADWFFAPILIFDCIEIIRKIKCSVIDKSLTLIGKHSMNLWYIHGIFFYVSEKMQAVLYWPKVSILILVWSLCIMIPVSIIYENISKNIRAIFTKLINNLKYF